MSERTRRLDHLLREEVSAILRREVHDPRIGFVTITRVDVTPDLRHATVWASIIGAESERRASMRALERAMPYVRHHLGPLRLRRIPELRVREDDTAERGTRVMELLERLDLDAEGSLAVDPDVLTRGTRPPPLPTPGPPLPTHGQALLPGDEAAARVAPTAPKRRRSRVDPVAVRKARERRGR